MQTCLFSADELVACGAASVDEITRNWPRSFVAKVDTSAGVDGCWPWLGGVRKGGYGHVNIAGKHLSTHRVAYELTTGEILGALKCDHRCHNTSCVNPVHLRAATTKQNQENLDGVPSNNTSGYRGVYWNKKLRRWQASVGHHGKLIHLGVFASKEDAAEAARHKRLELFTHNDQDRADGQFG